MAFGHGKDTHFELDTAASGNALTDISEYTDTADLARVIETGETTTFGDDTKTYIVGLQDATISIGGKWDPVLDAVIAGGAPIVRDFEFGPAGTSSGSIKYDSSGSASDGCIVTGYTISNPVAGVVTWSAEMQVTGPVTRGTY